jgi:hypothetical protein
LNFSNYTVVSGDFIKGIFPMISSVLCFFTLFLTARSGNFSEVEKDDKRVFALGVIAACVWKIADSPTFAQLLLQVALIIGFIPTFKKSYNRPESENTLAWCLWTLAFVFQTAFVLLTWEGQKMALVYPINMFICHGVVAAMVVYRSKHVPTPTQEKGKEQTA